MKIFAFAGTISSQSLNKKLLQHVLSHFEDAEVDYVDLIDYEMPNFSLEREKETGVHPLAQKFADKIDACDLIIMSLAEYNSSYTAAFKNTFDWFSRIRERKHFGEKPVFLLSTAPGPGGGVNVQNHFKERAPRSGAEVIESFVLPKFNENFEEGKGVTNEEKRQELEQKIKNVKDWFSKEK